MSARKSAITAPPSPSRPRGGFGSSWLLPVCCWPSRLRPPWPNIIPDSSPTPNSVNSISIEQTKLPLSRAAKGVGGKPGPVLCDAGPSTGDGKQRFDLFRKNAFAHHARTEMWVVQLDAARRPNAVQDFLL